MTRRKTSRNDRRDEKVVGGSVGIEDGKWELYSVGCSAVLALVLVKEERL